MPGHLQVQGEAWGVPRRQVPRAGRVARDSFTRRACGQGVTVGDALDTLTHEGLRYAIRAAIGPPAAVLEHTCDVIVDEVCRQWPERTMADLARKLDSESAGGKVLDALAVITARVREQIEARWHCRASEQAALDLILQGCVVEFANLWFSGPEARIGMRAVIGAVRRMPRA